MPPPKGRPFKKASQPTIAARVEQVVKIILFGGEYHDIVEYSRQDDPATGRPWNVCNATIFDYQNRAYEVIKQQVEKDRDRVWGRHIQQRRQMLALAMEAGDLGQALQIVKDEAALHGLYPSEKAVNVNVGERIVIVEEVIESHQPDTPGRQTQPSSGDLPK